MSAFASLRRTAVTPAASRYHTIRLLCTAGGREVEGGWLCRLEVEHNRHRRTQARQVQAGCTRVRESKALFPASLPPPPLPLPHRFPAKRGLKKRACEGEILSLLVDAEAPSSSLRWLGGFNLLPTPWSVQGEYSLQSEEQEGMQFKFQAQYPQLVPPRTTSASSSHLCKELQLKRAPIVYYWCCGHDSKSCI